MKNIMFDPERQGFTFDPMEIKKWCLTIVKSHTDGQGYFPAMVIKDYPGFIPINMRIDGNFEQALIGVQHMNKIIGISEKEMEEILESAIAASEKAEKNIQDRANKNQMN